MGTRYNIEEIPVRYRNDVEKAVEILLNAGCDEVYLFGSIVDGTSTQYSDIDIAARGIPPQNFFNIYGKLILNLDHPVELISIENDNRFSSMLLKEGNLHRVA